MPVSFDPAAYGVKATATFRWGGLLAALFAGCIIALPTHAQTDTCLADFAPGAVFDNYLSAAQYPGNRVNALVFSD